MKAGDRVTWLHTPRGGYGYSIPIDVEIVRLHEAHATVKIKNRSGAIEQRRVARSKLRKKSAPPRKLICKYCGCTLAGFSEVQPGSGVYNRPCYERDGDMCERTDAL